MKGSSRLAVHDGGYSRTGTEGIGKDVEDREGSGGT
jgi:hypothetical protein